MKTVAAAPPAKVSALADAERRRGLEAGWLVTLLAAFCATGLSWFLGAIELDVSRVLWGIFGCAVGGLALDVALALFENRYGFRAALELGHVPKILGLGALWHLLGGIDNVIFLSVFFLPTLTAGMLLMRRLVVVTATLSVTMVTLLALLESPELRWYLIQLGLPLEGLLSRLPPRLPGHGAPFVGIDLGPEFQFVALLVFATLLLSGALLCCLLATRTLALLRRFVTAFYAQDQSKDLFRSALREDPVPAVVVYADTGQIVDASRGFLNQMLLARNQLAGSTLFDRLSFSDEQSIRALLARPSGELRFTTYCVRGEWRTAGLQCHRIQVGGVEYASLTFVDRNELSYLWNVCDALDHPMLVVRHGSEVVYFNAAAEAVCKDLHFGMDVSPLLQAFDRPSGSWRNGDDEALFAPSSRSLRVRRFDVPAKVGGEPLALIGLFPAKSAHRDFRLERRAS